MPVATHTSVDWSKIRHYEPSDFNHPEKLDHSVVYGLDRLAFVIGKKAVVLSDWRLKSQFSDSMHPYGRAIDFTYPGLDSTEVLNKIRNQKLFTGIGMYVNAAGVVSFHVDTRTDRNPENPATWGARKGPGETEWVYTALRSIYNLVKPAAVQAAIPAVIWMFIMGFGIYWLAKRT